MITSEKPNCCKQEYIDYLWQQLNTIGTERPMWLDYLLERFPELTRAQADEIIFYCLEDYVVGQPALATADYYGF